MLIEKCERYIRREVRRRMTAYLQITGTRETADGSTLYQGVITLRTTPSITLKDLLSHIKTIEGIYAVEGEILE